MSRLVVNAVWCGPPAISHASAAVGRSGRGRQTARATGSLGSGSIGLDDVDLVDEQPEPVAEVGEADAPAAGPGAASNTSRTGSARPPIESGWISHDGRSVGDRRADLEHVRTEHLRHGVAEVVGVVLHERRAAGQAVSPRPSGSGRARRPSSRPRRRSRSPSAISRWTPMPGSCSRPPRSSNVSVKAPNAPVVEEGRGARPRSAPPSAARRDARPIARSAGATSYADSYSSTRASTSASGTASTRADQVADAVAVDREAESRLRLDLVAVGDGDLAHVVAEPRDAEPVRLVPAGGGACPRSRGARPRRVLPVADDRLAVPAEPRLDERELAVAVGRLVQVHEVHVDARPTAGRG